jgi:phytol kinase
LSLRLTLVNWLLPNLGLPTGTASLFPVSTLPGLFPTGAWTDWPLLLRSGLGGLWLAIVGLAAWTLYQHDAEPELVRKVVHIGTGNIILLAWGLALPAWMGIAAGLFFGAVALASYAKPFLPGINNVGRRSYGTFFYAISIGLLVGWFWTLGLPQYAVLGVLTMTWGDGLAGLIGRRWGRHPYSIWGSQKSWEGTIAMALISGAIALPLLAWSGLGLGLRIGAAAVVAIAAAGLEACSTDGLDNLTVPIGVAALAYGLSMGLG